jgi:hypothetical protein
MNTPRHFEIMEGYSVYRPTGTVTLEQAVQGGVEALTYAREQHLKKLLVVTTGLYGFDPPSLADRYFYILELANAAQGQVYVAAVIRQEMKDPQKFGTIVAQNAGFRLKAFESEEEALAWLKGVKWAGETEKIQFTHG